MNNKVNYPLVGFFVFLGIFLIFGFIYWLLQPSNDIEMKKYAIEFEESVLGLNQDSEVKYRGISVGKVTSLKINPDNMQEVEVIVNIIKSTPIKEDTVAKLTAQGITGLSYINLSMGSKEAPFLTKKASDKYPVIKTAPSFFKEFGTSIGSVSTNMSETLLQLQKALNDENQMELAKILKSSASILSKLDKTLDEKTMLNLQESIKSINNVSKKVDIMTPNVDRLVNNSITWENNVSNSLASIMNSYQTIAASMDKFHSSLDRGDFNVKEISTDIVPNLNHTLLDLQQLLISVDGIIEQYKRSPGDILFKQEDVKKGPGER